MSASVVKDNDTPAIREYSSPTDQKHSVASMVKYMPIFVWLPRYTRLKAVSDLIAGVTLGLTMIPQSIAYAALADLTAQYGLYSCFMGGFLYIIFGTIKEVSIGPSSLMALITLQYTRDMPIDFVILLCFLTGCIEFLMGVLNLGFTVDFISIPVTSGFISATSVIIIIAQLQGLLGLQYKSANIVDNLIKMFKNIGHVRLPDLALGVSSMVFLLIFRKLKDIECSCVRDESNASRSAVIRKVLWYFSISRNALIVFVTAAMAYRFEATGHVPFKLSGKIESGLPVISLPPFSTRVGNQTYTFFDMCAHYGSGIIILPVISILANVAIAKAFAIGVSVNATQEMLILGLCNIFGSFVSSMPTTGAFTRSAVGSASGIQTPMAGLYSGIMALLALSFLTPYFYYIPRATLSAVLITAVMFMIDLKIIKLLWKGSKMDTIAAIGTFLVCVLISVELGLLFGVLFNLAFLIRPSARPAIRIVNYKTELEMKYVMLKPDTCLYYPAVAYFCNKIINIARNEEENVPLIVDCKRFTSLDYTSIKAIEMLSKSLNLERNRFWLLHLNSNVVESINIFADNKHIRFIENEDSITDVLHGNMLLPNKESENLIMNSNAKKIVEKHLRCEEFLNLRLQQDGESAEEMALMSPIGSETQS